MKVEKTRIRLALQRKNITDFHVLPRDDLEAERNRDYYVDTTPEFNQTQSISFFHPFSRFKEVHDPARYQTRVLRNGNNVAGRNFDVGRYTVFPLFEGPCVLVRSGDAVNFSNDPLERDKLHVRV